MFAQVLQVAAEVGMARFATVAIDGTKIAADASIDSNRGPEWFKAQADEMIADAEQVDGVEDDTPPTSDLVPARLADPGNRVARIRQAAAELSRRTDREEQADAHRLATARARRERAEAGEGESPRVLWRLSLQGG